MLVPNVGGCSAFSGSGLKGGMMSDLELGRHGTGDVKVADKSQERNNSNQVGL
jgi:hypothetical protein